PTTRVEKISGTISDLMSRRKIVARGWEATAAAGAARPKIRPATMARPIQWLSLRRRKRVHIGAGSYRALGECAKWGLGPGTPKHFMHLSRETVARERLLQIVNTGLEHAVIDHRVVRIARHVQHAHLRTELGQLPGQDAAGDPGHHDVGQEQVDGA